MKGRDGVRESLEGYLGVDPLEESMRLRILSLISEHEDCFLRTCIPGHLTASAWVVAREPRCVLLLHHSKLDKWLQPGGHADGQEDLEQVARRELEEETGLQLNRVGATFFDLDVHVIPARGDVPAHEHHDLRFLFLLENPLPLHINHESREARWVALDKVEELNPDASLIRMVKKVSLHM